MLTLPLLLDDGTPFPARDLVIFLANAVILISLLVASIALPPLLRGVHFPSEPSEQIEEDRARRAAATAAIAAIEQAQIEQMPRAAEPEVYPQAAARVIALYRHRLNEAASRVDDRGKYRETDRAECTLRLAALQAERERVFELARHGQLSDDTSRKLVREIDLLESRYR